MKKVFTIFAFIGLGISQVNAQACSGVSTELPNTSVTDVLTPTSATLPCAVQGVPYNETITFKVPRDVTEPESVTVDSLEWVSISNLPCGLCWRVDRATKLYAHDEFGVITISGTPNDAVGQYDLLILVKAKLEGISTWESAQDASLANIGLSVRVQADGGSCAAYSTNPGRNAACVTTGINDVNNDIRKVTVAPNPMNNSATVSFLSEKTGNYTISVMDILGKTVSVKTIKAIAGNNTAVIERNNVPQGIYFVNITDGKSTATQKVVIAD